MDQLTGDLNNLTINVETLLYQLSNEYQKDIIRKIHREFSTHKMYLVDITNTEDIYQIKILGGLNNKNKRESYIIKLNNNKFTCNCKDFIFRSNTRNIVCKHITFIVLKVGNIYNNNYFETKILSDTQLKQFINIITSKTLWNNETLSIKNLNNSFKTNTKKELDKNEICPICFDLFGEDPVLNCPKCFNYVHQDCIKVWLETKNTCVYCRSECFKNYISNI